MIILRQTAKVFALIFLFFSFSDAQNSIYRIEAGTTLRVRMEFEVNSEAASKDDTFTVRTEDDLVSGQTVLVPKGSVIEGRVTEAISAGAGGRSGKLAVRFELLNLPDGNDRRIEAVPVTEFKARPSHRPTIIAIIGGTAAGALIGAISGKRGGAGIGAAIGAGTGAGIALARTGNDVKIASGEIFEIRLKKDVVLPVRDY